MKEFVLELATAADDSEIRTLLREQPVPGSISVRYEREPNYFLGCSVLGHSCQVLVARHGPTGRLAAVACRATRKLFVNGESREVGYLGQLRVASPYRGRFLVSQGFRFLRALHADDPVEGYLATIVDGNREATGVLVTRSMRQFPRFREVDQLWTLAYPVFRGRFNSSGPYSQRQACEADLARIIAFLRREGRRRQFFPAYSEVDFRTPATQGFRLQDFILIEDAGELVAVGGLWDQAEYKQTRVHGYAGAMNWWRPFCNVMAWARGSRSSMMPRPGHPVRAAYGSFLCIKEDASDVCRSLLLRLRCLARERGYAHLVVGFCSRDPLLDAARSLPHVAYLSRLYTAAWDGGDFHAGLDPRPPYVEVATL